MNLIKRTETCFGLVSQTKNTLNLIKRTETLCTGLGSGSGRSESHKENGNTDAVGGTPDLCNAAESHKENGNLIPKIQICFVLAIPSESHKENGNLSSKPPVAVQITVVIGIS